MNLYRRLASTSRIMSSSLSNLSTNSHDTLNDSTTTTNNHHSVVSSSSSTMQHASSTSNLATTAASIQPPTTTTPDSNAMLQDAEGFIHDVAQYYNLEDLSDLTIVVKYGEDGEIRFPGHKFVLAKSSDYFKVQLYSRNWKTEDDCDVLELHENEECACVFDKFLKFLYTAQVSIDCKSAIGVLYLADKYQVLSLKNLSVNYMMSNAQSPNLLNALNWYSLAKMLELKHLRKVCFNTICWNIVKVSQFEEYMSAPVDFIEDLLNSNELVIEDEYSLLELLQKWLSVENRFDQFVKQLLPKIRFPMMAVSQLYRLETSELAEHDESRHLLTDLVAKAYRFRSVCPHQLDLNVSFVEDFYRPRHYRNLCVDNIKIGTTMRFGFQVDLRTYSGAVPSISKDADWKMVYQKNMETWTMKLYSQDSSFPSGTQLVTQLSVLIEDDFGDVLQCFTSEEFHFVRSSQTYQCQFDIQRPDSARNLCLLLKPKPASHSIQQTTAGVATPSVGTTG